ncbi:MAG: kinase [SAR324 cluster bacterium]|nr:kinase [SAR324 cluster bacterium]
MIITRTPYRLSFFGGGTDYRPWFEEHGGLIIASAMARYCYLTVRTLPPFFEHKTRMVYSKIESVQTIDEIVHPSIKNCLKFLNIEDGLEIHHDGDLPARSGIGSSSSFTVGLLHALHALNYRMVSQRQLADEAIHVEQTLIGENVGIQDQIMAAFGGLQIIEMGPGAHYTTRQLILPPDYLKNLEDHILLGFSGISRESSKFAHTHIENIQQGKSSINL